MADTVSMPLDILDRMYRAVELVRERLFRTVRALEAGGVLYAVVGGHAVAYWVATVDDGAVRNTPEVNVLVRRADAPTAKAAMEAAGFVYGNTFGVVFFSTARRPSRVKVCICCMRVSR